MKDFVATPPLAAMLDFLSPEHLVLTYLPLSVFTFPQLKVISHWTAADRQVKLQVRLTSQHLAQGQEVHPGSWRVWTAAV